jgi:hypothetical protein
MVGGVMQLQAYGSEDIFLVGNPQITHFKAVYRRHTNFAMEYIEQYFTTTPILNTTNRTKMKCKIDRDADLLYDTYLVFILPDIISNQFYSFRWIKELGQHIIHSVEIDVGGQRIDIQYGQWLNIWTELTLSDDKRPAYEKMIGNPGKLRPGTGKGYYPTRNPPTDLAIPSDILYIPFEFWFCKNPALAIPLIALQYTEIYIYVEFNPLNELFTIQGYSPQTIFTSTDPVIMETASFLSSEGYNVNNVLDKFISGSWSKYTYLLSNFIYLDTDERRRFAQSSHEYLMHQVQQRVFTGLKAGTNTLEFSIYHPVKELIWVLQKDTIVAINDWHNYSIVETFDDYKSLKRNYYNQYDYIDEIISNTGNPDSKALINLEGTNGYLNPIEKNPTYAADPCFLGTGLSRTMAFNDFTNAMLSAKLIFNGNDRIAERDHKFFNALMCYKYHTHSVKDGIYLYTFALNPEEHQPSGTCDFSRIDKAQLQIVIRRLPTDIIDPSSMTNVIFATACDDLLTPQTIDRNLTEYTLTLYAVNYNIFRIMGGIGSVAFAS